MTELYNLVCLKNKLQHNLKYHILNSDKSFYLLNQIIQTLKNKYSENMKNYNDLEYLRIHLTNYSLNIESLKIEQWLSSIDDKSLINDLNNFVDITSTNELKEQIKDLQKQINVLREIVLQQNPYIERIDENTNK